MQPLKSSQTQTDRQTQTDADGNVHRHRSSNSSLDGLTEFEKKCIYFHLNHFWGSQHYENFETWTVLLEI